MSSDDMWFERPGDELDDDEFPDEFPDEDDYDDDYEESNETVPCPECGTEIYEDAVQCPVCEAYVTHHHGAWSGRPIWWIVLGLLGVAAVVAAFL